jgi:hypothetical protein
LPGKRATTEVEHHIAQGLHVITARLFDAKVCVDTSVPGGTSQVFVLTVRNVEVSLWVTVLLGQSKIDDVDLVTTLSDAHKEVIRLDIAVDEGLGVDVFDPGDELIGKEEDSLQRELAVAKVEEIFQTGPKQVQDHGIVVTFSSKPANEGNPNATSQRLVDTSLIFELGMLGLDRFEFDGNLFTRYDVGSKVDVTKASTADLASNAVFIPNAEILERVNVSTQFSK